MAHDGRDQRHCTGAWRGGPGRKSSLHDPENARVVGRIRLYNQSWSGAANLLFDLAYGVAADAQGNSSVADSSNKTVQKFSLQ